jgi:hypothetical protein
VAGGWRRLHNEELRNLNVSPNIITVIKSRAIRWAVHAVRMGELRNAHKILIGKRDGKRPLERRRRRWIDTIRMDLRKIGWEGVDWMHVAQGPVVGCCEHGNEPLCGFRCCLVIEYSN